MPHQNVQSGEATAQNAATERIQPNDQGREQNATASPEPRSYAAENHEDSTLAPPVAGETADYMDEGEALDGEVQSGGTRTNVAAHSRDDDRHGAKTTKAIRDQLKG